MATIGLDSIRLGELFGECDCVDARVELGPCRDILAHIVSVSRCLFGASLENAKALANLLNLLSEFIGSGRRLIALADEYLAAPRLVRNFRVRLASVRHGGDDSIPVGRILGNECRPAERLDARRELVPGAVNIAPSVEIDLVRRLKGRKVNLLAGLRINDIDEAAKLLGLLLGLEVAEFERVERDMTDEIIERRLSAAIAGAVGRRDLEARRSVRGKVARDDELADLALAELEADDRRLLALADRLLGSDGLAAERGEDRIEDRALAVSVLASDLD